MRFTEKKLAEKKKIFDEKNKMNLTPQSFAGFPLTLYFALFCLQIEFEILVVPIYV